MDRRDKATDFSAPGRYTGPCVKGGGALIYADVVMGLNFAVDFLLLLAADRLTGHPAAPGRAALAAGVGAVYSGVCLMPGFRFLSNWFWRLVFLGLMAGIAFGWNGSAIRRGGVFLLLSMALGGIALGFGTADIGMLILAALGLWLLCRYGLRSVGEQTYVPVELAYGEKKLKLLALRDTGNTLKDPLTGEQVLVAGADVAEELLGLTEQQLQHPVETLAKGVLPGLRLVPYRAVGQPGGMLLALRFQGAVVGKNVGSPLVAFAPQRLGRGAEYRMLTGGAV